MSFINVVMYHYVRPINDSDYPNIKGLELEGFKRQLDFLGSKFCFITAEDVVDAVMKGKEYLTIPVGLLLMTVTRIIFYMFCQS